MINVKMNRRFAYFLLVLAVAINMLVWSGPSARATATHHQGKGHITRLFHTDNWTGAQERFPDTGNVFSDIVAMQTRQEADIWLKPVSGHLFDQCPAHAGTILVELSMWEYNTFLPDSHIGNDKTINACNPESRATWVDVNEDQSIYIKGKMFGQTQCGNCSGGNFTYSWFGDPDDPWRHDSSEKRGSSDCYYQGQMDQVQVGQTRNHIQNEIFGNYVGPRIGGDWNDSGWHWEHRHYQGCNGWSTTEMSYKEKISDPDDPWKLAILQ